MYLRGRKLAAVEIPMDAPINDAAWKFLLFANSSSLRATSKRGLAASLCSYLEPASLSWKPTAGSGCDGVDQSLVGFVDRVGNMT